jgi:hypothetical protein
MSPPLVLGRQRAINGPSPKPQLNAGASSLGFKSLHDDEAGPFDDHPFAIL